MPTTNQEADKIIELCVKHGLKPRALIGLAKDLEEQVGRVTTNDSVRVTMNMLYDRAMELAAAHKAAWSTSLTTNAWFVLWLAIVIGHTGVWIALTLSCILTFIYQPWYLAMLAISFSVYLLCTDTTCPITRWENVIRRKMGWKEVGHFTHWYVICPIFHGRACDHKCPTCRVGPG